MTKFYNELARWWRLVSPPEEYVEEAAFFLDQLSQVTQRPPVTMLELGSGGGNNALHMKGAFAAVTLVDLSPDMLEMSQQINPECEHLVGDMRTIRLDRQFDVVFVHDAIDYMTTRESLKEAMETAFIHLKPGGMALFVPDHVTETFEPDSDHGGSDGEGRGIRFLEWSYDPDPTDTTCITDYVFMMREDGQPVHVEYDQHVLGLFPLETWLTLLQEAGFQVEHVMDDFERYVFIGRKAA
jgi:SAM-dependent methyltransferase